MYSTGNTDTGTHPARLLFRDAEKLKHDREG